MTTAKELAFKAYCDSLKIAVYKLQKKEGTYDFSIKTEDVYKTFDITESELKERFDNWWSEWYGREEHKDGFHKKHSVLIDLKTYIPAE
jgi:hypothetical protein